MTEEGTGARVAVIVVTYNSAALLPGLLASLPAGLAGIASWGLVIVDNASADNGAEVVEALAPHATIVPMTHNAGYAAAINRGLDAAGRYDAALVMNPDIRLTPCSVATLVERLNEPGIGIVVPQLFDGDGARITSLHREPTILRALGDGLLGSRRASRFPALSETIRDERCYVRRGVFDWASGSIMLISRQCATAVGRWDESFFLYSEEVDYCLRARDQGFALTLEPAAMATHLGGESRTSPELWALLTINRVRLYRRRHGSWPTLAFWSAVLVREGSRALLGSRTSTAAVWALLTSDRVRGPAR